jgi:hypothetical protein
MNGFFKQFILVILAFGTLAAQTVCACPDAARANRAMPQPASACSDEKCCLQDQPTLPSSAPNQGVPCDRCNIMHPADQIQPERHDSIALVDQPFLALLPVPLLYATTVAERLPEGSERVPITPQLRDLFHSRILLLV